MYLQKIKLLAKNNKFGSKLLAVYLMKILKKWLKKLKKMQKKIRKKEKQLTHVIMLML